MDAVFRSRGQHRLPREEETTHETLLWSEEVGLLDAWWPCRNNRYITNERDFSALGARQRASKDRSCPKNEGRQPFAGCVPIRSCFALPTR